MGLGLYGLNFGTELLRLLLSVIPGKSHGFGEGIWGKNQEVFREDPEI